MIITISGQYGSGGNEIGRSLAEIFGYKILDSQLIVRAREIYAQTSKSADRPDWWPSRSLTSYNEANDFPRLDSALGQAELKLKTDLITSDETFGDYGDETENVRKAMLEAQSRAILEYSEGGGCVIFGKCSDYILRDHKDTIRAFSKADMEVRIKRIMNLYNMNMDKTTGSKWLPPSYTLQEAGQFLDMERRDAIALIYSTDKRRSDLFEFLTGEKWGAGDYIDYHISGNDENLDNQTNMFLEFIRERI
ncbi:MAG: cytidylate kinase-like family protein [Oscillospiraceae bacterium]|nr:cytidylate kinase-like family protein [Oscillospiraceae bacterium]